MSNLENAIQALKNKKAIYVTTGTCDVPKSVCHRYSPTSSCDNCYLGEANIDKLLATIKDNEQAIKLHLLMTGNEQ